MSHWLACDVTLDLSSRKIYEVFLCCYFYKSEDVLICKKDTARVGCIHE